jgi:hypothetical protein
VLGIGIAVQIDVSSTSWYWFFCQVSIRIKECTSALRNIFAVEDVVDISSSRDQPHLPRFHKMEHQDH